MENLQTIINGMYEMLSNDLPQPTHEYGRHEDIKILMRDNVGLMTRIFYPAGDGPWPVLLVRNPYTPVNNDAFMQQPFLVFLKYGYAIVYQQVRGLFDSEGEWAAFVNEREDGLDTLGWIAKQPWSGYIGTYGGSYLGHVQWCMADNLPDKVKAMYISVYGGEPYDLFYENRMFKQGTWTLWATQMMEADKKKDDQSAQDLTVFREAVKITPQLDMDKHLTGRECPWYRSWITNPDREEDYWNEGIWGILRRMAETAIVPVCFQTGWYDIFLSSALRTFDMLTPDIKRQSRLLIGPWHHGNQPAGDLEYPNEGKMGFLQIKDALLWFNHYLKGAELPYETGVICAYEIGGGAWRTLKDWDASENLILYMDSRRTLSPCKEETVSSIGYIYDPSNPVPTLGGNLLTNYHADDGIPECSVRQEEPNWREDVVSFISEPLHEDINITGSMLVQLYVSSDAPDTSFTAKVMEVVEKGHSYNIRDGITTLACRKTDEYQADYRCGEITKLEIPMTGIMWRIKAGSRLRVDISSSNFPAFHIHPNLAGTWAEQEKAQIAKQILYMGENYDACIKIPVNKH